MQTLNNLFTNKKIGRYIQNTKENLLIYALIMRHYFIHTRKDYMNGFLEQNTNHFECFQLKFQLNFHFSFLN